MMMCQWHFLSFIITTVNFHCAVLRNTPPRCTAKSAYSPRVHLGALDGQWEVSIMLRQFYPQYPQNRKLHRPQTKVRMLLKRVYPPPLHRSYLASHHMAHSHSLYELKCTRSISVHNKKRSHKTLQNKVTSDIQTGISDQSLPGI